ncbi:MAG: hypothetical protein K0R46_1842 [Herbinix sp.]|jgi:hypothetical protein|nr:hypothetical protein [Herbinix sp.]
MSLEDIKGISGIIGIPLTALIVVIACLFNLDKLYMLAGTLQKLFVGVSKTARKGTVSNSIKGRVIKATKMVKSLDVDVMIPDFKIQWVKEESVESFINKNQAIIRLEYKSNPHKNFVTAVTAFVDVGLLPKAKKYVNKEIIKASRLAVCRDIILKGDSEALDYFDDNILDPLKNESEEVRDLLNDIKTLDGNGMFYQILLNEYSKSARQLYPEEIGDQCFTYETSEFLRFLHNIATGSVTDVSEFYFNRNYFKIRIFLTANSITYKFNGTKVYLKHLFKSIDDGIETIYLFGLGKKAAIAKEITEEAIQKDFRIAKIIPHEYRHRNYESGRSVKGVCFEINVYKNSEESDVAV